jgi:hypothetical protein
MRKPSENPDALAEPDPDEEADVQLELVDRWDNGLDFGALTEALPRDTQG